MGWLFNCFGEMAQTKVTCAAESPSFDCESGAARGQGLSAAVGATAAAVLALTVGW